MRIKEVRASNFRVLGDARLELDDMTALIGSNGSGKTAMLLAIARFFDKAETMHSANFGRKDLPITVTVVAEGEAGQTTEVTREWKADTGRDRAVSAGYTHGNNALAGLDELLKARVVYVPAGNELSSGSGGRRVKRDTVLQSLIDSVAGRRETGAPRRGDGQEMDRADLERVEETINKKLGARDGIGYSPSICVRLRFGDPVGRTGLMMDITDRETGRELDYAHVGHGARRALHMAALETDADILGKGGAVTLYIIDEPELHQHPMRQALVLGALRKLSEAPSSQVIYATHSPYLVELGPRMRICRIRRLGERTVTQSAPGVEPGGGGAACPIGEAIFANGAILVEGYSDAMVLRDILRATPYDGRPIIDTLASKEIAVMDCGSKYNIEHYYRALVRLGIACFVLWDGDMGMKEAPALAQAQSTNTKLLEIIGEAGRAREIQRAGACDCIVGANWACFGHDLPSYFARYSDSGPKELERKVKGGMGIVSMLDARFSQSEFCKAALPSLCRTLLE